MECIDSLIEELERPSSVVAFEAERESEQGIIPRAEFKLRQDGWDNKTRSEGRPCSRIACRKESRWRLAMNLTDAQERATVLQSTLYQSAKRAPARRYHALYDKLFREDVLWVAWENVRRNGGAAGPDGVSIKSISSEGVPAFLSSLAQELKERRYRPSPVLRVEIPKGGGKPRPLGIPTVKDRVVQAAAKLVLEPIFEADFAEQSYGFRPGIGQPEALASVGEAARKNFRFVVDADIEGFFDTLDHERLMAALRRRISDGALLRLIWMWLKAGVFVGGVLADTGQGTPQGGVLSPLLANIYLHGFDTAHQGQHLFLGRLTRYADDFVIQCGTRHHAEKALAWAQEQMAALGLRLHPEKTRIVEDSQEGFDFLGFHHRRIPLRACPSHLYPAIWPSRKACQKFRDRLKELLRRQGYVHKREDWQKLQGSINRYLRGFGQYFRKGRYHQALGGLDFYVSERVARHLARSQPVGKKRRRRRWTWYARWLGQSRLLVKLAGRAGWSANPYRGQANIRWKAV